MTAAACVWYGHKFVSPTHCERCGMPVGGWRIVTTNSSNIGADRD